MPASPVVAAAGRLAAKAARWAPSLWVWAVIVWIVVVYLGEHYVTDVIGGVAYATIGDPHRANAVVAIAATRPSPA